MRLGILFVSLVLPFVFIVLRLVHLQVRPNPELATLASRQFQKVGKVAPYRQPIYDRNGEELAVSVPSASVYARPKLIRGRRRTARALSRVLGGTPAKWLQRLDNQKPFVWLHRQLDAESARRLSRLDLPGVFIEPENKRVYPNGPLAASVLGFTDIDGNGLSGLELALNGELLAKQSKIRLPRDGKGNLSYIDRRYAGSDEGQRGGVYVTLDRRLQHAVEEELEKALAETGAKAALAVVMDPHTGEVFALGQKPSFDPNTPSQSSPGAFTNRILSHLYEPGSVLKPIFAAEAIQSGILTADSPIDCGQGKIAIGPDVVREAESHEKFGVIPLHHMMRVSSNVGAVRIAQMLGTKRMPAALERFGLTARTGINLPGETAGSSRAASFWKVPMQLAAAGFGQGIALTPIQMVASYAPFANGGYLVRPRILVQDLPKPGESPALRHVLSPHTVQAMRRMLVSVTQAKDATGVAAAIPGIHVAGKTGTAQKYEAGAGYGGKKYFSSFIGFLPAEKPELLIGVMVDEPRSKFYASQVAAPLFKSIAIRALHILGRVPRLPVATLEAPKPAVVAAPRKSEPPQWTTAGAGAWLMPDLRGLAIREALREVGSRFTSIQIVGNGYLENQTPKAGTVVSGDTPVSLTFHPES